MRNLEKINEHIYALCLPYKDIFTTVYFIMTDSGVLIFDTASYDCDVEDAILPALRELGVGEDDLKYVLPAFCYLINKAKNVVGRLLIILNTGLKDEITDGFAAACENYGVAYLRLENIDKQKGHPTELGMRQIAEQVAGALK